ncbi:MAG: tRNA epoxyqueuosine(34) reductase QueG [Chromatiales bacterium]|jgi:epoxyqueuosine reductase|nr:tRNA epoxyqueuosine(34) reductase QueG [Chromatiales bacterium]
MPETQHPIAQSAEINSAALAQEIVRWGRELGFDAIGFADIELGAHTAHLRAWIAAGHHGEMDYMARHHELRARPEALHPGTVRVISARMNYLPPEGTPPTQVLADPTLAYISRYALGRDYHKVMRARLRALAERIAMRSGPFGYRVFTDSAPVLEKALAEKAGLGWIGKHTNLIATQTGSWFFLGEIYTDLPLPVSTAAKNHCGSCRACIDVCPTGAITAPYQLDARRCISYLTIELRGSIPEALRPALGNRIFGCDDCQLVCPWNRHAQTASVGDFAPRHRLDAPELIALFAWDETEFLHRTEGSAIRRTGHIGWLRNLAVALGNALREAPEKEHPRLIAALSARLDHAEEIVREHVRWALAQQVSRLASGMMAKL